MTRTGATAIGFIAVLLWALLALFTVGSAPVPPFQLSAICFMIGGLVGCTWLAWSKGGISRLYGIPFRVWMLGVAGLFGYHA
ncbi:MAG: EamA family transporter, partial [Pseudomonadota bacterium]